MDIKSHLRALGNSFVAVFIILAMLGYIVITLVGYMDLREYLVFLGAMIIAYYVVISRGLFWLIILGYGAFLLANYFVPEMYFERIRTVVRNEIEQVVQEIEGNPKQASGPAVQEPVMVKPAPAQIVK